MPIPKKSDGWGVIADYIIKKEEDGSWGNAAGESSESLSFTRWGLELAKTIGISKYTFWQCRRAGLLYKMLLETLPPDNQTPLCNLSKVTPEHLNELQKLSRVAPPELFKELCERVIIKNNITRKELRDLWASLRPAMEGETARGRTKQKSFGIRIKENNEHARNLLVEGLILVAIKEELGTIFGKSNNPHLIDCREQSRPYPSELVDALVLCSTDKHGFGYEVHGICIGVAHEDAILALLEKDNPSFPCDKLWLVMTHNLGNKATPFDNYPNYLGIIEAVVDAETVKVTSLNITRIPQSITNHYQHTVNLLSAALCKG
jgi:hypothetical protein